MHTLIPSNQNETDLQSKRYCCTSSPKIQGDEWSVPVEVWGDQTCKTHLPIGLSIF